MLAANSRVTDGTKTAKFGVVLGIRSHTTSILSSHRQSHKVSLITKASTNNMVKHPQSTLGYAVNGVVVLQPTPRILSRSENERTSPRDARIAARRTRQDKQRWQQRKHQFHVLLRNQPRMEDLKNACKRGDLREALSTAHSLARGIPFVVSKTDQVLTMIRILFTPDMEGRSAIYYAAHTGQDQMVQVFLALLVMERSWRRGWAIRNYESAPKTMLGWLEYVGFPRHFFSRSDLDLCVLNALSDTTRKVFRGTKFSWERIFDTVTNANLVKPICFLSVFHLHNEKQLQGATTSQKLPKLCVQDDLDPYFDGMDELDDSDYDDEEECILELESDNAEVCDHVVASPLNSSATVGVLESHCDHTTDAKALETSDAQIAQTSSNDVESQWMEVGSNLQVVENIPFSVLGEDNDFSLVHDEDESWMDHTMEGGLSFVPQSKGDLHCESSGWEVLADSYSVISLDSHPVRKTYLEALLENQLDAPDFGRIPKHSLRKFHYHVLSRVHETEGEEKEEEEDDEENMFDAFFLLEGAKGARGGKSSLLFKGEGRTRRR